MFPLLAMGLLGGLGLLRQGAYDDRKQAGAAQVQGLLGAAPRDMGPPTEDGTMGKMPGQGLLADLSNPQLQAQFAQGLLTLPRQQQETAARMYGDLFQRVQQGQQFQQTEKRQGSQFDRSEQRLVSQFDRSQAQSADQFGQEMGFRKGQADTGNQQWERTFAATRGEAAQRLALEGQRLELERQRGGGQGGAGMAELPKGYMYVPSAQGMVAAPIPGTKDYADATGTEQELQRAVSNIHRFLDVYAGREVGPNGVRVGGAGNQWSGEKSGEMAAIRSTIISSFGKLRDLGTLQKSDLQDLAKVLTDPSSKSSFFSTKGGTVKAYEEVGRQFTSKLLAHRNANPWLLPPPPPGAQIDGAPGGANPGAAPRPSGGSGSGAPGASSSDRRAGLLFPAGEQ